jgi:ATP-dependent Clp protease, protease subunit
VRALLKAESYLTAAEAKEAGFADVVTENVKATASFELENLPTNIQALFKAVAQEEPKTPPTATIADQVAALAKDAGLESLSAFFATNYDDVPSAEKALGVAREIKSLCALAKLEKKADGFIQAKKSIVDVRAELCNALATEDEQRPTDTAQRNDRSPQNNSQPKAISTASIWAARHKSQQGV